jgi:FkbM family methyltransferase
MDKDLENKIQDSLDKLITRKPISDLNRKYLGYLKHIQKYEPLVIYDIGSSLGAYAKQCHLLFPDSKVILFEANDVFEKEYYGEDYNIVCLSDENNKEVKFYNNPKNDDNDDVSSLYKSIVLKDDFKILNTLTLDTYVSKKCLRTPDLIKIACNGAELEVIKGGVNIIKKCEYLIVRLQNYELFEGGTTADVCGPYIKDLGFELKEILDSYGNRIVDYVFKNKNI